MRPTWQKAMLLMACYYLNVSCPPVSAQALATRKADISYPASSQDQKRSLIHILEDMGKMYHVTIFFDREELKEKMGTINLENNGKENFEPMLEKVLVPYNLGFVKLDDHSYLITHPSEKKQGISFAGKSLEALKTEEKRELLATLNKVNMTVSGTVTSLTDGQPLPGVNIIVKGSGNGTVTDVQGKYSLNVPDENASLIFTSVGYTSEEIAVNGRTVIDISLAEDIQSLNELVVVGYSTQKKADLTGAVSFMETEEVKDLAVTGIENAMLGKMPGVTVLQNSGAPGASSSVRIRGIGTLGNNNPLYVVDGVPVTNLNDIDPNTIASMDVLKDAASAAIYGSRAANGVVIITTKKGEKGEGIKVDVNVQQGFQAPTNKIDVLNAQQRNLIHSEAYANSGQTIPGYYATDEAQMTRTNWQDQIFNNAAYLSSYNVALRGGSENATYAIMADHFNNNGILKNTNYQRTNFRINTALNLTPNITVGENVMIGLNNNKVINTLNDYTGALYSALLYQPDIPVYTDNGDLSGVGALGGDVENPVGIINRSDDVIRRNRILGDVYLEWKWFDKLTFKTDFGYDWAQAQEKIFVPSVPEAGRQSSYNELSQEDSKISHWISTNTLKYETDFAKNHLMVLGGVSWEEYTIDSENATATGFISEEPKARYFTAATNIISLQSDRQAWSLLSYFGRADYAFDGKYLASVNLRADGSSKFSQGNQWGVFPSFSLGWRLSDEAFFAPLTATVSNLKLRGSWGQLGNQNISDNYPTYAIINNTTDNDGYYVVFGEGENNTIGRYESNIPNQDIQWEITTQWNVGLDMGLFKDAVQMSLDYFEKSSSDILLQVPITSLAGVTTAPWRNAGVVNNKGLEMALSYQGHINQVNYEVSGNIATLNNEVASLGNNDQAIYGNTFRGNTIVRTTVGESIAHFYGYQTDGIFNTQEEINNYTNESGDLLQSSAQPGDIKFIDYNQDGVIDADDRTNLGSGFPKLTYGLNLNATYKGFDFNASLYGVGGNKILNATKWTGMFVDPHYNQYAAIQDRWTPENTDTDVPRVSIDDPNGNRQISDFYVENGSYLRLRNLSVGYSLPSSMTDRWAINGLRVYVTAQNLFTVTNYSGIDPQIGESYPGTYGASEIGVDRGQYPQAKTFLVGFNLNF